jgi:hypothetical protein
MNIEFSSPQISWKISAGCDCGQLKVDLKFFHPTGIYSYCASDLALEVVPESDAYSRVVISDPGEMFVFELDNRGNECRYEMKISEYIPPSGSGKLVISDRFEGEYKNEMNAFISKIREIR